MVSSRGSVRPNGAEPSRAQPRCTGEMRRSSPPRRTPRERGAEASRSRARRRRAGLPKGVAGGISSCSGAGSPAWAEAPLRIALARFAMGGPGLAFRSRIRIGVPERVRCGSLETTRAGAGSARFKQEPAAAAQAAGGRTEVRRAASRRPSPPVAHGVHASSPRCLRRARRRVRRRVSRGKPRPRSGRARPAAAPSDHARRRRERRTGRGRSRFNSRPTTGAGGRASLTWAWRR